MNRIFFVLLMVTFTCVSCNTNEIREIRYLNGKIKARIRVKKDSAGNAIMHGKATTWYENGKKASEGKYQDDKKHGKWIQWHENGEKLWTEEYRSGKSNIIDKVKSLGSNKQALSIGKWINQLAGVEGTVKWKSFRPQKSRYLIVEATLKKRNRNARIQYKYNPNTEVVEMGSIEIDGKPKSLLLGSLELQMTQLNDKKSKDIEKEVDSNIISLGARDRQHIHYKFRVGTGDLYRLKQNIKIQARGRSIKQNLAMDYQMKVTAVKGKLATLKVRFMNFKGSSIARVKSLFDKLAKTPSTVTMNSRGQTKSFKFNTENPMLKRVISQMKNQLNQISIVWPEKPVGVGAKWNHNVDFSGGMKKLSAKAKLVVRYTLKKFGACPGSKGKCAFLDCPISMNVKGKVKGQAISMKGKGTGTITFNVDLGRLEKVVMKIVVKLRGSKRDITTKTALTMKRIGVAK